MIRPWLLWTLAAILLWGVWALLTKGMGDALNASQCQAISTLGMIPVIALLLRPAFTQSPDPTASNPHSRKGCVLAACSSGFLTCLGNMTYYHALNLGGNASTLIPLTALYPVVTVLLAVLIFRERVGSIQWLGLTGSLLAIYLLNVPKDTPWMASPSMGYTLAPILLWGIAGLLQKAATRNLTGEAATFWFLLAFIPVGAALAGFSSWPNSIQPSSWILGIALGFFFGFGNFALLMAYARHGKASMIAPLASLYPMVSIPAAILIFKESVGTREWLGIILALCAGIAMAIEPSPGSATDLTPQK